MQHHEQTMHQKVAEIHQVKENIAYNSSNSRERRYDVFGNLPHQFELIKNVNANALRV